MLVHKTVLLKPQQLCYIILIIKLLIANTPKEVVTSILSRMTFDWNKDFTRTLTNEHSDAFHFPVWRPLQNLANYKVQNSASERFKHHPVNLKRV